MSRRGKKGRVKQILGALAAVVAVAAAGVLNQELPGGGAADSTVVQVIDGDTIDVSLGGDTARVRLLNIDTPERGECLYDEAAGRLRELLPLGTKVRLEYDVERTDRYDRHLAGVFVDSTFINEQMVAAGLARVVEYEPNVKFSDRLSVAAIAPRQQQVGIYGVAPECMFTGDLAGAAHARLVEELAQVRQNPRDVGAAERARQSVAMLRAWVKEQRNFTFREQAYDYLDRQGLLIDELVAR